MLRVLKLNVTVAGTNGGTPGARELLFSFILFLMLFPVSQGGVCASTIGKGPRSGRTSVGGAVLLLISIAVSLGIAII